ncbi:hypothetical protein E2C01_017469 [Portunus trituberculatus]|uniref:Uncharacterized protein n=1 Tax=Portunus trituberculatus TaxID=210409 RepID=A0A5B7DSK1_PORTR|nr:hypothetical protein [Portunus trituberculatus]
MLPVTAAGIIQLKDFVTTRWRLWSALQEWEDEDTHEAAKGWLQECRIPTGGGWRSVLWLMNSSSRHLGCLKEQIRKTAVERDAFSRRFLSLLLCLAVCLHVASVLLVWRAWPRNNKKVVQNKDEANTENNNKKPLIKTLVNTWKKRKVRNLKILSVKRKLKHYPYKEKWNNFRSFVGMNRWRKHTNTSESQLRKELQMYMTKNRKKTYIHILKLAVTEMFDVFLLMTVNNIRRKLKLGSPLSLGAQSRRRMKEK